ncbi:hypothetical protein [Caballeronia sp. Lep1P3]|uniref:hypothetical protein n=1 Tax=Caballeronia sp. Lep1P3 TaxID=2878150 RepID=UPI001FD4F2CA|nr:hypothetical protein [Caballeronia sp. Lep1P3]
MTEKISKLCQRDFPVALFFRLEHGARAAAGGARADGGPACPDARCDSFDDFRHKEWILLIVNGEIKSLLVRDDIFKGSRGQSFNAHEIFVEGLSVSGY